MFTRTKICNVKKMLSRTVISGREGKNDTRQYQYLMITVFKHQQDKV